MSSVIPGILFTAACLWMGWRSKQWADAVRAAKAPKRGGRLGDRIEPGELVYVAGPFTPYKDAHGITHQTPENVDAAELIAQRVRRMGFTPFCPHLAIPYPGTGRKGWVIAMRECLRHLANTQGTVMMLNWLHSEGACAEEAATRHHGRPVFYSIAEMILQVEEWRQDDPDYAARLDAYAAASETLALVA